MDANGGRNRCRGNAIANEKPRNHFSVVRRVEESIGCFFLVQANLEKCIFCVFLFWKKGAKVQTESHSDTSE